MGENNNFNAMILGAYIILFLGAFIGAMNLLPTITDYPTFLFTNLNSMVLMAFQLNWILPIHEMIQVLDWELYIVIWSLVFVGIWKAFKMAKPSGS